MNPKYYTFWSINGPLSQSRLREQMEAFQAAGLDGVVFHPRFYPGIPPYMSPTYLDIVSRAILDAKKLGLIFWMYDENGWPSGTADGQLLARHPECAAVRLDLMDKPHADEIGSFQTAPNGELAPRGASDAKTWHMVPRVVEGIDTLNPEVCLHFLDLIHERYRTGLDPEAFEYIEAFFADEPESGAIKSPFPEVAGAPWSPNMAAALRKKFGPDYVQRLPLLFARGEGYREFRIAYWELVTDLVGDGFFAPYLSWCVKHDKLFVGHVKGEEHPLFQLPMVGSCHRIYRQLSMPGIDSLERYPAHDFYPRQASSVARQFGDGRCMVECFGGAGWGAAPEDLERYLLWLGRNGITEYVFHLSQYRLDSAAIRDWPPSEPLHLSWREAFPEVLRRVSAELSARPPGPRDTLVVAPYRGMMAEYEPWELMKTNQHVATTYPDTPAGRLNRAFLAKLDELKAAGIAYDVSDERTVETDGRLEDGRLRLGNVSYGKVVLAAGVEPPRTPNLNVNLNVSRNERRVSASSEAGGAARLPRRSAAETGPETLVRSVPAAGAEIRNLAWRLDTPANAWLLETKPEGAGAFQGEFRTDFGPGEGAGVSLRFADDLDSLSVDGKPIEFRSTGDGTVAPLPPLGRGSHALGFRCVRETRVAYVWLEGGFSVASATPFVPGPNGTVRTEGPFTASARPVGPRGDLVAGGLPFMFRPLVAEAAVELPRPASAFRFDGLAADALRMSIEGRELGWAWGPDWTVRPSRLVAAGTRRIRLDLFPSTYNHFGPHHYYNGDWHVVSGDQMVGVKNFADLDDAPVPTHIAAWHFKPLKLPETMALG